MKYENKLKSDNHDYNSVCKHLSLERKRTEGSVLSTSPRFGKNGNDIGFFNSADRKSSVLGKPLWTYRKEDVDQKEPTHMDDSGNLIKKSNLSNFGEVSIFTFCKQNTKTEKDFSRQQYEQETEKEIDDEFKPKELQDKEESELSVDFFSVNGTKMEDLGVDSHD
jgi:hypothetical protein